MKLETSADLWHYVALDCFERRRRYPLGSLERTLCVERARWHIGGYRAAMRAATMWPPEDQTARRPINRSEAEHRKWLLFVTHPDTSTMIDESLGPRLICPPGKLSPTSSYLRFQDTIAEFEAQEPDKLSYPRYAAAVRIILDWRAEIPPEYRFWRPDPIEAPAP